MGTKFFSVQLVSLIVAGSLLLSCQKEIDATIAGGITSVVKKPKLGTQWTYLSSTFYADGSLRENHFVTYKAISEETYGNEKWLNIADVLTNTTIFLLNEKTGGLYQYANNASNLFCKYPAALNDTYSTYNAGSPEDFTVKGVNDTIPCGLGNLAVNYYEGVKGGNIIDKIWYNDNTWIAQKYFYAKFVIGNVYYKYSSLILQDIIY